MLFKTSRFGSLVVFAWNSSLVLELGSKKKKKRKKKDTSKWSRWRSFHFNQPLCFRTQDHGSTKNWEQKYNFYYCFVLSIKGRVTWTNSTDKVHIGSSARTFQLVVWAHKRSCIIIIYLNYLMRFCYFVAPVPENERLLFILNKG